MIAQARLTILCERAGSALAILYAGVPIMLKLIAVALMWGFPLDREALSQARDLPPP